ncbi:cytochrome c biogenesis protein CcsA [Paracrocinitomix mangrovi]|uniref:cytochrome c biogenesis protein CcsA n=1 Tax=Paracrocinitomix mangrovi TaxID=2862509 RepID=UPI001C8F04B9|nr:cytochrome c biogenesis protein CcsA [Paracrocinitomix mangrovi]UKN02753.1 cytochrome c biogenesis protein CcsA [Paracrocinitomix mangrovi]
MPLTVLALLAFFMLIGWATFIENDFGRDVAYKWVYRTNWFTLLLFYLSFSLLYNIIRYKLLRWQKMSSLLFHLAFLVIAIGALVTRYIGYEGVMTIREGASSNIIVTQDTYLQIKAHDTQDQYTFDLPVYLDTNAISYVSEDTKWSHPLSFAFNHNNYFEHAFDFKEHNIQMKSLDIIRNPMDTLIPDVEGDAYIDLVTGGMQHHYIQAGTTKQFENGLKISFETEAFPEAVKVFQTDTGLYVLSPYDMGWMKMNGPRPGVMDTSNIEQGVIFKDSIHEFIPKHLYQIGEMNIMFNNFYLGARKEVLASNRNMNGYVALRLEIDQDGDKTELLLKGGKGQYPAYEYIQIGDMYYEIAFGSRVIELPFSLALRDFQMEKYPGTMKPSSYASEVTLIDTEEGINEDYRIFMNNVLDHRGYRFFQSSYDPDERGTILSVNHDKPGTILTYLGYLLLGIGFFINLFGKNSRFRMLIKKADEIREKREKLSLMLLLLIGLSTTTYAQDNQQIDLPVIDAEHADKFSRLLIQDFEGRIKPVHTTALELLRKVSRQSSYKDQSATQTFISWHTHPFLWFQEPIIFVSGPKLREKLNLDGSRAAFIDFMNTDMSYILEEEVAEANRKSASSRSEYDKDLIKTDERFSIMLGVINGYYLRIFPKPNDTTHTWYSPYDGSANRTTEDSLFVSGAMKLYMNSVIEGTQTGDWDGANKVVDLISTYQHKTTPEEMLPSSTKVELEIAYNKLNIFKIIMNFILFISLVLLVLYFIQIFATSFKFGWMMKIGFWLMAVFGILHGLGLGVRWYLSGHAPWSDGYEAVVFIAFVTLVAGMIFYFKNRIVLGAAGILIWLLLFVAHMNQMDPTITPLVPVLKSYWLMIHVAVITGSYAFLGLGAMIGLIIMSLFVFMNRDNYKKILLTSKELSHISEIIITIGLFMLTIGTFLGGVWANESWGRYWGWDPKETWALASVVAYVMLLHIRFIPFMKSQFAFNFWSFWAFGSIIMTFFGVNFYLSGLHSYAQGDPVPIPLWVPIAVGLFGVLSLVAFIKWLQAKKWREEGKMSFKDDMQ